MSMKALEWIVFSIFSFLVGMSSFGMMFTHARRVARLRAAEMNVRPLHLATVGWHIGMAWMLGNLCPPLGPRPIWQIALPLGIIVASSYGMFSLVMRAIDREAVRERMARLDALSDGPLAPPAP